MESCKTCGYKSYPRVKAVHPRTAPLVIIGEAVNITEIRTGVYFQSQAGDVLKETLKKVGLPYDQYQGDVYFTSAIKCRPPAGKVIGKEAIHNCRKTLIEELQVVKPRMIITLGATATQMLMNDTSLKITKMLGQVLAHKDFPDVPIIPCYNPSMVLRSPATYKIFHQIIRMAEGIYHQTNVLDPGETTYEILRTKEDVLQAKQILADVALIGCDIETTGLNCRIDKILTVGLSYAKNKCFVLATSAFEFMNELLTLPNLFQIWHNGKFDTSFLIPRGFAGKVDHDIMLLHYCLNESSGTHDLGQLSTFFLGASEYKSVANAFIKSKEGFASASEQVLFDRVAIDADYTLQLFHVLYPQVMADGGLKNVYENLLIPGSDLLCNIELHGLEMHPPSLEALQLQYDKEIQALLTTIEDAVEGIWDPDLYVAQTGAKSASEKFKPSSTKQMSWLVYDRLKLNPPKRSGRSTDEATLLSLAGPAANDEEAKLLLDKRYPLFGKILDLRSLRKEQSTYVKGMLNRMDENNRVHTSFSLHITATGRLSSKDPNIQNIPSDKLDVRRCIIPPPGKLLMECDYQGAELRVLAHVSGDKNLKTIFQQGRNLHNEVATRFYGDNFTHADKMAAKTINFGIPYGRKAYSIALQLNKTEKEAQELIDEWFDMFPEAHAYLLSCDADVKAGRALTSPLGRKRRFGLIHKDSLDGAMNEARNFRIQSTASDLTLLSAIRLYKPLKEKYDTMIVNLVHDSILVEVPDNPEIINEVAKLMKYEMAETPKIWLRTDVPFGIDCEIGPTWGDIAEYIPY